MTHNPCEHFIQWLKLIQRNLLDNFSKVNFQYQLHQAASFLVHIVAQSASISNILLGVCEMQF